MERVDSVSLDTALAIIRNCMTLMRVGDFDESVRTVVKNILDISEARSCRIMLIDNENHQAVNFCEVISDSFNGEGIPGDGNIPYGVVKMWEQMIGSKDSVIIRDQSEIDALPPQAQGLVAMMKRNRTTSLIMLPLRRGNEVIGFMYVINFNKEKTKEVRDLLELMSFFIATEVFNNQLMERLRRMSVEDELTGLHNRNAMMNRINSITEAKAAHTVGIINMDLNGLKTINDTRGHESGDMYLKHAAEVMKSIFGAEDVYRSGGDEFIAIVEGLTHDEFSQLIGRVQQRNSDDPDFNLSLGYYWSEDGIADARTAFKNADESMYVDKKRYYGLHPEMDRRGRS